MQSRSSSMAETILWVFRRIKYYIIINGFICAIATCSLALTDRLNYPLVGVYLGTLLRIVTILIWFEWVASFKAKIYGTKRNQLTKKQAWSIILRILTVVIPTEMLSQYIGQRYVNPIHYKSYLEEFVYFIPKSLVVEIIFDLFHYSMHLLCHRVPWLYQNVHKRHHLHLHPTALSTYEQDGVDLLLTNVLPLASAIVICPCLTIWQFQLLLAYKTYVEIAGHCGLDIKGMSFPQMPLVQGLSICLRVHDHDLHHTKPNVNFAKRFSLWDKFFGTFEPSHT